ncbi:MAG: heavy metal translocating P-type ATPase, partial [Clostridia bacterium]|nr:heavy metal translocating P-type ATPase [Clostridia bacterium]
APVIATSDVGVAMGLGSDVAIETADMVLMSEKIGDLNKAIKISKLTMKTVYSNIIFALGIKLVVLILALFGLSFMAIAVFADVGVSIIAIINSSRILAKKIK